MQKSDRPASPAAAAAAIATAAPASGPRSRGRPRAFDRKAALAEATRLFWMKGYDATSISDLTAAMGIGSTSLYAAFGSKEALYAEAVDHYRETYEHLVWGGFLAAATARDAVQALLTDSAAALTGCRADIPHGCMVALSAIGSEAHTALVELLQNARAATLQRLEARFATAVTMGDIPPATDIHALARFIQTVQTGMSILARDGAGRAELEAVAGVAMAGWDQWVGR